MRQRKPVARTQSAPHRRPGHPRHLLKRQTSSEALPTADQDQEPETHQPCITSPKSVSEPGSDHFSLELAGLLLTPLLLIQYGSVKRAHEPVPWIKVSQNRESSEMKTVNEQLNVLDRVRLSS